MSKTGGCLCGAVRYTINTPLRDVLECHCSMCRRSHGHIGAYSAVPRAGLELTDPTGLRWYASSPGAERGFCTRCGSTLFFRSARWPDELHVVVANLHQPLDRAPQVHVFWESHVPWADVDPNDGLARKRSA